MTNITAEAIQTLHWTDLETLVDLIFARRGWYRSSPIGGAQKLVDLAVEHVTTGEIAAVQVKAPATKAIVEDWIRDVDLTGIYDRLFFICPQLTVQATTYQDRQDIHVWTVRDLAKSTVQHGLATWVLEKIA